MRERAIVWIGVLLVAGCLDKGPDFFLPFGFDEEIPTTGGVGGRVTVDGSGTPGVAVGVSGAVGRTATTGADGTYAVDGLPAGSYTVSVTAPSGTTCPDPRTVQVPAGGTATADFDCRSTGGTVTGTVTVNGSPIGGATVSVDGRTATTASDGSFAIPDLAPGTYTVGATASGFQCAPVTTTVTAGGTSTVAIPCTATPPSGAEIAGSYRLDGVIRGTDGCGTGSTITNPGPITIRAEGSGGTTLVTIESDADVSGAYQPGTEWTGSGTTTVSSGGSTFTLRETVRGTWEREPDGTIVLRGTLTLELFDAGGTKVCESVYDATYRRTG